jgi:outer membrane putative beta-barrel porin/alpha-amylase
MRSAALAAACLLSLAVAGCAAPSYPEFLYGPPVGPLEGREGELPGVTVEGTPSPVKGPASEDGLVGENRQPEWTTRRRFTTTRVYVASPWQTSVELWDRSRFDSGESRESRYQAEVSLGLPYRFQVDYYHNFEEAPDDRIRDSGPQVEARWALADWGELWGNPTAYLEYKWDSLGADKVEAKALLGGDLAPRFHSGANLIWEQETSGARATELGVSGAVSYALLDRVLGVGLEGKVTRVTENGSRGDSVTEIALGPSLQWRFHPRAHLDVAFLPGLNRDTHDLEVFVILGWDFGGGDESRLAPTSTRSN